MLGLVVVWLVARLLVGSAAGDGLASVPPASVAPTAVTASPSVATASDPGRSTDVSPRGPLERATVVRVTDGDTIVVDLDDGTRARVRFIGIDSPELDDGDPAIRAMGELARDANEAALANGIVLLERDVSQVDRFGRLLRYVWVEDAGGPLRLVNLDLVAGGFARVVTFPPDVARLDQLRAAQDRAREAGLGLWAIPGG